MEDGEISLEGLDKAAVLAALYNGSQQLGMGFLHSRGATDMTVEQAREEIEARKGHDRLYFDYLHGRVMKADLSKDTLKTWLYDRDNGQGAAARIVDGLRKQSVAA